MVKVCLFDAAADWLEGDVRSDSGLLRVAEENGHGRGTPAVGIAMDFQ